MLNFISNLKNILPLTKNSNLPAIIFAISLFSFYIFENLQIESMLIINILFYIFCIASYGVLIYFNNRKPAMFILVMLLSYIAINFLKKYIPNQYLQSPYYINICVIVPINLLIFYLIPSKKLFSKENAFILIGIFLQIAIIEYLSAKNSDLGYSAFWSSEGINPVSFLLFIIATTILLIKSCITGRILDSYLLFAFIEIMFGFIYSKNTTALGIFFLASSLTIFLAICYDTYYITYKDLITGLSSRNSYIINSKDLPLKYSIGIIKIDELERLKVIFSKRELANLIRMISMKIIETNDVSDIYKYSDDEFVIIFKNKDTKETFEEIDDMRRRVASSDFALKNRKKPIKLTVSASISTKKRSDANSFEVLSRAKKALEKTGQFTQNITSKA